VISGNVSFYNETKGLGIYPTPTIGMVGIVEDVSKATTQWFKDEGDSVILLGESKEEIGGTEYLKVIHSQERGMPPDIDLDVEAALQKAALEMIQAGLVKSAHDCSEGGLAVALAECCFRGAGDPIGCDVEITDTFRADAALFGETQSRIIISAAQNNLDKLLDTAKKHGVPARVMGRVGGGSLVIRRDGAALIDSPMAGLKKVWQEAIPKMLST
jgi:phosphoribosylformylglycinamidine (FGAM) synthase-like enzyme